jgi:hypothetical protein
VTATIAERVAAGEALLDERRPGWLQAIDLATLDLGSAFDCVLGQVYAGGDRSGYSAGMFELDLWDNGDLACGFYWTAADGLPAEQAEIHALTAEWSRRVLARRAADREVIVAAPAVAGPAMAGAR